MTKRQTKRATDAVAFVRDALGRVTGAADSTPMESGYARNGRGEIADADIGSDWFDYCWDVSVRRITSTNFATAEASCPVKGITGHGTGKDRGRARSAA